MEAPLRSPFLTDVSVEERAFARPCLTLLTGDAPQRRPAPARGRQRLERSSERVPDVEFDP